jgi:hypothetical protein
MKTPLAVISSDRDYVAAIHSGSLHLGERQGPARRREPPPPIRPGPLHPTRQGPSPSASPWWASRPRHVSFRTVSVRSNLNLADSLVGIAATPRVVSRHHAPRGRGPGDRIGEVRRLGASELGHRAIGRGVVRHRCTRADSVWRPRVITFVFKDSITFVFKDSSIGS